MNLLETSKRLDMSDHAGVVFPPPLLLGVCIVMVFFARRLVPLDFMSVGLSLYVGPVIVGMSFALCYWALCPLRRSGTTVDIKRPSTTVVMGGLFRFSRNPIYLSTVLLQIGVGVWANSLWFFGLALLSYALLTWGVILREERYLGRKFGEAYAEYRARVRRWL